MAKEVTDDRVGNIAARNGESRRDMAGLCRHAEVISGFNQRRSEVDLFHNTFANGRIDCLVIDEPERRVDFPIDFSDG